MRRAVVLVALAACGDDGAMSVDGGAGDGGGDGASGCDRVPAAADRTRYVVVARPYDSSGTGANVYEVLSLSADGTLAQMTPATLFTLGGRASFGTIPFTPDGKVGFVAFNEGGKIGVFSIAADGTPTVIDPGFDGVGDPAAVLVSPDGDTLYIVDRNTRNNGGGIYAATIHCDGTLTDRGLVAAARSPVGIAFRSSTAVIGARDLLDHEVLGDEVHLASLGAAPMRIAGGDAFGDDDQVMSQFALSADASTVFIGDGNAAGVNRVGIATITDSSVAFAATLTDIVDPGGIAVSPFGNVAIVSAAQGNRIFQLDKAGANNAWRKVEVTTLGGNPQIPADMVSLDRGMLRGHVWVSENTSVRHVRFTQAGGVEDLGSLAFGAGLQNIPGAIGITP